MTKYILIHGYAGKDLSHWLQWVDKKLSPNESVFFPSYESSKTPNMEQWLGLFEKEIDSNPDDNYVFIAHSIGCLVTMKLIERHNIRVSHMILVACPQNRIEAHSQLLEKISLEEKNIFTKFVEHNYNWNMIQSKVNTSTFFFSDDDFAIPYADTLSYYQNLFPRGEFKTFHNYGHFNRKNNILELPEVFEALE